MRLLIAVVALASLLTTALGLTIQGANLGLQGGNQVQGIGTDAQDNDTEIIGTTNPGAGAILDPDTSDLPPHTQIGCNLGAYQDAWARFRVLDAAIYWCESNPMGRLSIQSFSWDHQNSFVICNYHKFSNQSCTTDQILQAKNLLTEHCGKTAAYIWHKDIDMTFAFDGYPTTVCDNMLLPKRKRGITEEEYVLVSNDSTTDENGVVSSTIEYALREELEDIGHE